MKIVMVEKGHYEFENKNKRADLREKVIVIGIALALAGLGATVYLMNHRVQAGAPGVEYQFDSIHNVGIWTTSSGIAVLPGKDFFAQRDEASGLR